MKQSGTSGARIPALYFGFVLASEPY